MSKLAVFGIVMMVLLSTVTPDRKKFEKYKAIEAYEIRPGILMMPRYSDDGRVCEIGLEKLHYSPEVVRLDSSLSDKEINEIFDELVPSDQRGPQPENPIERILGGGISGNAMTSAQQYQNVSFYIYGSLSGDPLGDSKTPAILDELAATIKWKNRKCE